MRSAMACGCLLRHAARRSYSPDPTIRVLTLSRAMYQPQEGARLVLPCDVACLVEEGAAFDALAREKTHHKPLREVEMTLDDDFVVVLIHVPLRR